MSNFLINAPSNHISQLQKYETNSLLFDSKASSGAQKVVSDINEGESFGSIFKAYLSMLEQTNELQIANETLQLDFAAGKTDDMLAVILAQEKAFTSLNFTVQVTNKIIDAYREIMRIQV